jgi:hypothetical protein
MFAGLRQMAKNMLIHGGRILHNGNLGELFAKNQPLLGATVAVSGHIGFSSELERKEACFTGPKGTPTAKATGASWQYELDYGFGWKRRAETSEVQWDVYI